MFFDGGAPNPPTQVYRCFTPSPITRTVSGSKSRSAGCSSGSLSHGAASSRPSHLLLHTSIATRSRKARETELIALIREGREGRFREVFWQPASLWLHLDAVLRPRRRPGALVDADDPRWVIRWCGSRQVTPQPPPSPTRTLCPGPRDRGRPRLFVASAPYPVVGRDLPMSRPGRDGPRRVFCDRRVLRRSAGCWGLRHTATNAPTPASWPAAVTTFP